jgi:drug/metabolite transporter (DMT)-like permease
VSADPRLGHDLRRGAIAMTASVLFFTGNALLLKQLSGPRGIDPWLALVFRAAIGLALTWLIFAPRGTLSIRRGFQSWLLASRGVLGVLGTAAYYVTIEPLGAGKSTLIGNTWCVFAALMAAVVLHERLSLVKLLGILLAFAGLGLLTGLGSGSFQEVGRHELIALIGALFAAAVVVVIRQLTLTESSGTIFASQCVWGILVGLPVAALNFHGVGITDVLLLSTAALCATLGQLGMTEGFRYLPVAVGGAFQITVPLATTIGSIALFAEPFTPTQIAGAALVLWGCFQTVALGRRTRASA